MAMDLTWLRRAINIRYRKRRGRRRTTTTISSERRGGIVALGDFPRVAFFPQRSETRRGEAWEQRKDTRQRRRGKEKGSEGDKRRQGSIEDSHKEGRHSNILLSCIHLALTRLDRAEPFFLHHALKHRSRLVPG